MLRDSVFSDIMDYYKKHKVSELLNFLSIEFKVMLTAALPIIELRGAIPVGILPGGAAVEVMCVVEI